MKFTLNREESYDSFKNQLKYMAIELARDNRAAFKNGDNEIEIRRATWLDRIWRFFGCSAYKNSQLKEIMSVYLSRNQEWTVQELGCKNSILASRRITFVSQSKVGELFCQQKRIIAENAQARLTNLQTNIEKLESREIEIKERFRQERRSIAKNAQANLTIIENRIKRLESREGKLIGAHLSDYNRLFIYLKEEYNKKVKAIQVDVPLVASNFRDEQFRLVIDGLRGDVKTADIILISSEGTEISAHSLFLKNLSYFTNDSFKKMHKNDADKIQKTQLDFSEDIINYYLDIKYGIVTNDKLPHEKVVELFYLANYVQDKGVEDSLFSVLVQTLSPYNLDVLLPNLFGVILALTDPHAHEDEICTFLLDLENASNSVQKEWFEILFQMRERGDVYVRNYLGFCYGKGIGVDKNIFESKRWYKLAADDGLDWSQYNLGILFYQEGRISQNKEECLKYLLMAADQGLQKARDML